MAQPRAINVLMPATSARPNLLGQKVVATGPYALVRHPMYAGAFFIIFGASIAPGPGGASCPPG
jgi:protein-S-isoprenylcysteine O-methyltransferase Ste14